MDEASIVYVGGNSPSELSLIHYNMIKMSRAEKQLQVPEDDKNFPISGYRSFCDNLKNLVYLYGGKTTRGCTTGTYQLKQVSKDDGKIIEIEKLDSMKFARAYHGGLFFTYNKDKFLLAVGGQQTQKILSLALGNKDIDTMTVSSTGYENEAPTQCIAECEMYDINRKKWIQLPDLVIKKSHTSLCALEGTTIIY